VDLTYTITDSDTSEATGTLTVSFDDDAPTAYADSNSANEGQQNVAGNVLTDGTDDVFGADGADAAGGVVGVAAGNTGSALDSPGTLGAAIETTYGFLTLNADGSYDYDAKANVAIPEGAQDVFTYTIKDADGDLHFTTLTIDLTDSGLIAANDDLVLVNEAALDLAQDGTDLAAGIVTGSLPGSTAETDDSQTVDDNITGGSGTKTFALLDGVTPTNAPVEGTYGWIQVNSDGTYTYTLTKPFTTSPAANDGTNTIDNAESFTYQVTNGNGNTETATIYINIVDDVPTAAIALTGAILGVDETAGVNDPDDAAPLTADGQSLGQASILGSALFTDTSVFGADGPAGSSDTVYSLQILVADSTGLTDTLSSQAVNLVDNNGVIEGRTAISNALVFTIEIDETDGDTTLTQYRAVVHDDPADPDESGASAAMLADGSLAIQVTVTDGDGDIDFAQVALNDVFAFEDDGPTILSIQNGLLDNEANLSITGHITATPGSDGIVSYQLDPTAINEPSALDYIYSNNNTQLVAKDGVGEDVFSLQVNSDGTYDFTLFKPAPETLAITPPFDTVDFPNHADEHTINLYSSYDADGNGIGDPIGTVTFRVDDFATQYLAVSQDGLGIDNNLMNVGEKMFMDFDSAVSDATFGIGNFSTGDVMVWRVYDENGIEIDSGTITNSFFDTEGNVVNLSNSESPNYSINLEANGLVAPDGFYSMSLEATTNSYKFTGFSVEKSLTVEDQIYDFSVVAIDGDGDISANAGFTVTIDGTGSILTGSSSSDVINGGSGDDFLVGGDGDDLLFGGLGDDSLTGGAGADIFAVSAIGDQGHDTITDFSMADQDVLHIYDVLDGDPANVDVDVAVSGGDVLLTINSTTQVTIEGLGGDLEWTDGSPHSLNDLISNNIVDLSNDPPTI